MKKISLLILVLASLGLAENAQNTIKKDAVDLLLEGYKNLTEKTAALEKRITSLEENTAPRWYSNGKLSVWACKINWSVNYYKDRSNLDEFGTTQCHFPQKGGISQASPEITFLTSLASNDCTNKFKEIKKEKSSSSFSKCEVGEAACTDTYVSKEEMIDCSKLKKD